MSFLIWLSSTSDTNLFFMASGTPQTWPSAPDFAPLIAHGASVRWHHDFRSTKHREPTYFETFEVECTVDTRRFPASSEFPLSRCRRHPRRRGHNELVYQ